MAVASRAGVVTRVVAVDQRHATGDRPDVVDDGVEVQPAGPGMADVEDEPGLELADRVPEPGDRVEVTSHGVVPAGRVLDEHRQPEPALVRLARERLAPVVHPRGFVRLGQDVPAVHHDGGGAERRGHAGVGREQLATRYPDAVVGRRDVDRVRRVDDDGQGRRRDLVGSRVRLRRLPVLRVGEEQLHRVGARRGRLRQRVGVVVPRAGVDADDSRLGHGLRAQHWKSRGELIADVVSFARAASWTSAASTSACVATALSTTLDAVRASVR